MTGARREMVVLQSVRANMPHLGLDAEDLLVVPGSLPKKLESSSLHASSYLPDFTPLVQRLLQLRRPGGTLSIGLCGPAPDVVARALAATQIAIGLTQHGLGAVVVDGDFSQPGLSGLLVDPYQEGLVDMVRFGRSCRALLSQPEPGGPYLLGTGSFPLQGPEPFEAEAWRGIVHRVALHSEVAVYVGPLQVEQAENPMLGAVDQVVYVLRETSPAQEDLQRLRHSTARVAALVAFVSQVPRPAPEVPAPAVEPSEDELADRTAAPSLASASPAPPAEAVPLRDEEIAAFVEEALPEVEATPASDAVPTEATEFAPLPETKPELRAVTEPEPEVAEEPAATMAFTEEGAEGVQGEPEPVGARYDEITRGEAAQRPDDATRPPEEAAELRRKLGLDEGEFSYSSAPRYSRVPLYLFLVLMATISGFVGWTLWQSHTGGGTPIRVGPAPGGGPVEPQHTPVQPPPTASGTPEQAAPEQGTQAAGVSEPDDSAAQQATSSTDGAATDATQQGQDGTETEPAATAAPPEQASTAAGGTSPPPEATPSGGDATGSPAVVTPPQGPVYAVHVASYRRMEQANQEIANLRKHGYEGRALRTDLGSKGIWFRVLVGSYSTREEAEAAREVILKLPEYAFAQVRRVTEP